MEHKICTLARYTMPIMVAFTLSACQIEDGDKPNDDLYQAADNEVVIYYKRDGDDARAATDGYEGWGLHLWNGEGCTSTDLEAMGIDGATSWESPYLSDGFNETYGAYYVLKVDLEASDPHECMNFILHKGNERAFGGGNLQVELRNLDEYRSIFGFHGSSELFYTPTSERPVVIDGRKAHWLSEDSLGWEAAQSAAKVVMFYDTSAQIRMDDNKQVIGGQQIELSIDGNLSAELKTRFPHLSSFPAISIDVDPELMKAALKSQIVLVAYNSAGKVLSATEVQNAGVLDAVFAKQGAGNALSEELGAIPSGDAATFKLWAPTAQSVELLIYNDDKTPAETFKMVENSATGVWSSDQIPSVVGKYYRYGVTVYHPTLGTVITRLVTDPYSLSLSANSLYSQAVDLDQPELMPADWATSGHVRPQVAKDTDHVLYESHLRDFSFSDTRGSEALNGKYLALTEPSRESVTHLQALKDGGLTTLHILPAFDIATVDEVNQIDITDNIEQLCTVKPDASVCANENGGSTIESVLASYDPTSGQAQALMNDLRMLDSFNWGYDPYHYTVPEGSYATDAEGTKRILEFREMVKATHDMGLKIVMDVVYNHTNASGDNQKSVLDKIVPGYYHRLDVNTGDVEQSTCCDNTATENLMMGKLMVDSLKVWADDYKVDGFRFDLMGHQPKPLMVEALEEVRAIDSNTLFYGEGWDFGEVSNDTRFEQSTQINMAGTGIGTFSDRLRDAIRGGSPFDGGVNGDGLHPLRFNQGFGNAAYVNEEVSIGSETDKAMLHNQDLVRLGMAGNLADYVLLDFEGNTKTGKDVDYNGAPAGYTHNPSENISYVSKHDNQTLWDNNAYKIASGTASSERARMQTVALSSVMLGQGIPFIHMGSELLRSKSMQRDSYDSGDWFNRVKFDGSDNNWNVGLPREDKDGSNWALIKTILADTTAEPTPSDIALAKQQFIELLTIRDSSELFRLETAQEVMNRVDFRNVGENQVQGLIVMSIDNAGYSLSGESTYSAIVVVINSTSTSQTYSVDGAEAFSLHPVQLSSSDDIVKGALFSGSSFTVPALTTAVFVQKNGDGLPVDTTSKDVSSIPPYGETKIYVKGEMNGWSAEETWKLAFQSSGVYRMTHSLAAGSYLFKIADADWTSPNLGCDTLTQATGSLELGTNGDCKLSNIEAGDYTFELNVVDTSTPVLSVTKN